MNKEKENEEEEKEEVKPELLRPDKAAKFLAISKPQLYKISKPDEFPTKIKLSPGVTGWRREDLIEYLERKKEFVKKTREKKGISLGEM